MLASPASEAQVMAWTKQGLPPAAHTVTVKVGLRISQWQLLRILFWEHPAGEVPRNKADMGASI